MTRKDLEFLQSQQEYPSVSIFVRTHREMPARQGDPIAVKNAVKEAEELLLKEFSKRDIEPLMKNLEEATSLIDYTQVLDGLAIFVNANFKQVFVLPVPVENRVVVDKTFVTRDIVKLINHLPRYWALAISDNETRLFYGVADSVSEVIEPITDTLGVSRDGFPMQYSKPKIDAFEVSMFTHNKKNSYLDSRYLEEHKRTFLSRIDRLLARFTDIEPLPFFVMGTVNNIALFEEAHQGLPIEGKIEGDYSRGNIHEISRALRPLVAEVIERNRKKMLHELQDAVGRLHHAFGIHAVWRMTREGRVHALLIEEGYAPAYGINPDNPDDIMRIDDPALVASTEDFVNSMLDLVIQKGGTVTFCKPGELKEFEQIAAILRY